MISLTGDELIANYETHRTRRARRRTWGAWTLRDGDYLYTRAGGYEYGFDLHDFDTSAQVLDMVAQIASKSWATAALIGNLVYAFNDILRLQVNYCCWGVEQGPIDVAALLAERRTIAAVDR